LTVYCNFRKHTASAFYHPNSVLSQEIG